MRISRGFYDKIAIQNDMIMGCFTGASDKIFSEVLHMMLSTRGRYAVMAVVELAGRGSNEVVKLSSISDSQDIPLSYLEQIFLRLRRANIVQSVKGPGGGYMIVRSASKISVMNVIDAVDESIKMTRCGHGKFCMKSGAKCHTHDLWKGLGYHIREYLSSISIDDVLTNDLIV